MSSEQAVYSTDLAGIVVGDTEISDVQGDSGLLSYRGTDINEQRKAELICQTTIHF